MKISSLSYRYGFDMGERLYVMRIPLCISGATKQIQFLEKKDYQEEAEYYRGLVAGFKSGYPKDNPVHPTGECRID